MSEHVARVKVTRIVHGSPVESTFDIGVGGRLCLDGAEAIDVEVVDIRRITTGLPELDVYQPPSQLADTEK